MSNLMDDHRITADLLIHICCFFYTLFNDKQVAADFSFPFRIHVREDLRKIVTGKKVIYIFIVIVYPRF